MIAGKHAVTEALKNQKRTVLKVFLTEESKNTLNRENQNLNLLKNVKIFKVCKWDHCEHKNANVFDDALFIGRVQVNMNDGKKRRFLYFTADYQIRK